MGNTERVSAICLLSGGMDSCVTLAHGLRDCSSVITLHAVYGQRTAARELRACREICSHYGLTPPFVVELPHIASFGGSSLLDGGPDLPPRDGPQPSDGVPSTYVPFRNGTLLAIATACAEANEAQRIYIGAVEEDSSGYPDCRQSFFLAYTQAIEQGTRPGTNITIETPVITLSKSEIVREGLRVGAPLHLTWSCYRDSERACGTCDSCKLRLRAFEAAGCSDPIPYREG